MQRLILGLFSAVLFLQSATIDRSRPPATPPIPDVKLPSREVFKLPNGLTVVVAKDSRFPLLTVRLAFLAGSKYDPQDLPGLSENVAALLNQGTASPISADKSQHPPSTTISPWPEVASRRPRANF